ncbi:MAG: flagellar biosynthesis protein FlgE [Sulfurospirillum sp.]|nr:flagellar biosynthesis protein FlgE [Sulfurospirillum sp.]MBL0703671.1 flagellar biosynthesis protein FlgE [Sulfurospirillum sp.]
MNINTNSMMAHQDWMNSNANNIANVNTEGFKSTQTTIQNRSQNSVQALTKSTEDGTNLAREITEQIPIEKAHSANAKAIKAYDEMIGSLIDLTV